jgi:hypothetical protein
MTVFVYVDTSKQVGDRDHLKVFANADAVPFAQEPGALLKTSSCLTLSISLHFSCRPLRATSASVTGYPRSIPC